MDCEDVGKFLQVYIDGELDDEDRRMVEEHLTGCSACRARADYERRFRSAVRARLPRVRAPEGLRHRVAEAMSGARARPLFARPLVWGSVPALVALALVITFTWTVTSGFSGMVGEAVDQHATAPPVEVNSSDSSEVEHWFRRKVDFNVALPRFHDRKLDLVGARLSRLVRQRAALVRYRRAGHDYSLFVVSDPGGSLEGSLCQRLRSREICLSELRGYTVVMWRARGLAYSLVGDAPPQDMLEVLDSSFSF